MNATLNKYSQLVRLKDNQNIVVLNNWELLKIVGGRKAPSDNEI